VASRVVLSSIELVSGICRTVKNSQLKPMDSVDVFSEARCTSLFLIELSEDDRVFYENAM
jgi:hypothetical protein